ncbi:MAG TPA: lysylphosphatidylglycerol synthase transmembrane domain-containing protein [Gaiellaceae bacterium]|nr:lysylphosphatidylglycerol synthase transmembrane domain-containing protein [Gaiellaceae bacterium]
MSRPLRVALTLLVTSLATAYVIWKIDLARTIEIIGETRLGYFAAALAITIATTWPMALRWKWLLDAKGIHDRLAWLTRAYFVSYAAGQVLPTAIGGDASRIYETSRRHPGNTGTIAGAVVLERAIGGAATLILAAAGLALAIGEYDVGVYLWIEAVFVVFTVVGGFLIFSRSARAWLRWLGPVLARIRLDRPMRALYEGMHGFREHPRVMLSVFSLTMGIQVARILAIWLCGEALGLGLSPRPYFVLGPLLFLVMLVPFTINGLAVREAFFIDFLTRLDVDADAAAATGFLFFATTIGLALPGAVIIAWEAIRSPAQRSVPDA